LIIYLDDLFLSFLPNIESTNDDILNDLFFFLSLLLLSSLLFFLWLISYSYLLIHDDLDDDNELDDRYD